MPSILGKDLAKMVLVRYPALPFKINEVPSAVQFPHDVADQDIGDARSLPEEDFPLESNPESVEFGIQRLFLSIRSNRPFSRGVEVGELLLVLGT